MIFPLVDLDYYDTYLAVVSTAANMTKGITKKKNKNRIRPISITAIQNASIPSTGVSQNFIRFLAIRFNSLFYATWNDNKNEINGVH